MASPTANATKAIQPRIALQGCSALHRAAFIGTAVSGLPMAVSPGLVGASSLGSPASHVRGAGTRTVVVPAPLRNVGLAGEDGPVSTPTTTGVPGRLVLTGYAVAQLFLSILMIALFVLWVVGGMLVVVWVGIGILVAVLPATRWVANLHRTMAGRT